ncbi:MAG TPA: PIG-L family deacetylase [Thermomicrobiales bacterium]|jgi:N-acetyl-1-D-myo-inositol-2-amino-2-deoxy-alpha-D-glucopyranoside deacetylase/mycothiol S-conjugate amidase
MPDTLLAIGAHPDDETMFAGGTLAWAAARGMAVQVLGVTRGEGGEHGEPPVTTQERLGETREAEMRAAVAALGLAEVAFLPYVDPLVTHTGDDPAPPTALFRIAATPEEFTGAIVAVIRRVRPAVLITHGSNGEYGHPQHIYTNEAVRRAFEAAGDPAQFPAAGEPHAPAALYTWAAHFPHGDDPRLERLLNADDPANWIVALDEQLLDRKERAASAHLTQVPLFLRRAEGKPLRAMLLARESLRRVALRDGATDPLEALLAAEPLARRAGE